MNYTISIIIPLSKLDFFDSCVDSISTQTIHDAELIIVCDNKSCMGHAINITNKIKHMNIKIIENEKCLGAGMSRNIGIENSNGKYIAFIDDDDLYPSPFTLEELYKTSLKYDCDICGGCLFTIDSNKNVINKYINKQYFTKSGWYDYSKYQFEGGFTRFLYKRSFLDKHNIRFPSYLRHQDPIFLVNAMVKAEEFYAIDLYVYAYRKKHKLIPWNTRLVHDHLLAIYDIIKIAKKHNLIILYQSMKKNFFTTLSRRVRKIYILKNIKIVCMILKEIFRIEFWRFFDVRNHRL